MIESIPIPFQALLWPLLGAALIGILGRLLPGWIRRLVAATAAGLPVLALWSLRDVPLERVEIFWEPLGFFRASPSLYTDPLSLTSGILLCVVATALLLGIRARRRAGAPWHGLLLLSLAGALAMAMASNLLTLALGSGLLDLALVGLALWAGGDPERGREMSLWLAVPGVVSTLVLAASALNLDVSAGHTSLLARELPAATVTLLGIAALLRLSLFPLHPRGLRGPQNAAALLLPTGAGIYLLARVQAISAGLWSPAWLLLLGSIALLAGGLLVWAGGLATRRQDGPPRLAGFWAGLLIHQVGSALLFGILLGTASPWPLISLPFALGALAIWWQAAVEHKDNAGRSRLQRLWQRTEPRRADLQQRAIARIPALGYLRGSRFMGWLMVLLPLLILASVAGAPLTAGARVRWPIYAALLKRASGTLLIILAADTFVIAGLGSALRAGLVRAGDRRLSPAPLVAAAALSFLLILLPLFPGGLGLKPVRASGISVWGLGLIFVLPWLLGAWLSGLRVRLQDYAGAVQSLVELGWLYDALGWLGQRLVFFFAWLGQIGEGDGWWGWALIILALGAIFLGTR
ncbi:MAG: hypothetical protein P8129_14190 [Anaerolineae bacterium]